jgi:hypothetical protein
MELVRVVLADLSDTTRGEPSPACDGSVARPDLVQHPEHRGPAIQVGGLLLPGPLRPGSFRPSGLRPHEAIPASWPMRHGRKNVRAARSGTFISERCTRIPKVSSKMDKATQHRGPQVSYSIPTVAETSTRFVIPRAVALRSSRLPSGKKAGPAVIN